MARLHSKVAIVTGAAQGIGLGIARAFVSEGATVILTDIQDDRGTRAAEELGEGAAFHRLDVREDRDWKRTVDRVLADHHTLDILVNNAGITGFGIAPHGHDPEHANLDLWRQVFATNFEGVALGCKHAIRAMRPRGEGSIVNIASRSGVVGVPRAAAYAASKAAVRHHTKSVALYCAEERLNIRCNAVSPAAILTPMWDPMLGEGPARDEAIARIGADAPLNRFGAVEEVASLVVHLASDESAYTTGAEFTIDGGTLAGPINRVPPASE